MVSQKVPTCHPEPPLVILSPSPPVILSGAKDLGFRLRINSAKGPGFWHRVISAKERKIA